jgi:NhaP-type Na+/H+ or K+/H+ antiporter
MLAVGSQVLASRLRIPALIILLPAGFIAGALTSDVNPERLLGAGFQPLVSLAVAVILYDAGLELELAELRGHTRRVVIRLISWGVAITWASAALLLGMSTGGGADDERHPGGVRGRGGGSAVALHPADGTAATGCSLGRDR